MSDIKLRDVVDALLKDITFEGPVTVDDCLAVANALKDAAPKASIEVHFHTGHPGDEVVIRVDSLERKFLVT
jgi:hypothetical protein